MKRGVIFIVLLFVAAVMFSSCRSAQNCPAYGQVEIEKVVHS